MINRRSVAETNRSPPAPIASAAQPTFVQGINAVKDRTRGVTNAVSAVVGYATPPSCDAFLGPVGPLSSASLCQFVGRRLPVTVNAA
jgi:hypothetical protein